MNAKYLIFFISTFVFFLLPGQVMASTLALDPASGTYNRSCPFSLNITLNTAGAEIDGTDAYVLYDNSRLTATSVTPGTIFSEYSGTNVDDSSGKVSVSGLASVSKGFNGSGVLATINFTVKENAPSGATQIKFDFDPNNMSKTTDSNVVQRGTVAETLNSVVNGTYTIGTGSCVAASPSPGASAAGGKGGTGAPGTTGQGATGSESAQIKQIPYKDLDQITGGTTGGNGQWTATLVIVGSVLTVLGILGLALL